MSELKQRGCGERQQEALYIEVTTSENGLPIEHFLVDPTRKYEVKSIRSPEFIQDAQTGIIHLILGVGKEHYPYVSDFVEEAKIMGISKRIPNNFKPYGLTAGLSRFLLWHPRAIAEGNYEIQNRRTCPKGIKIQHRCIGDLWELSSLESIKEKHELVEIQNGYQVFTPSCEYTIGKVTGEVKYSGGIFLNFPIFKFVYVNAKGTIPKHIQENLKTFNLECADE